MGKSPKGTQMPSMKSPAVFVSSTCYDLSEVRLQLKEFIESFGFEAMLSEFDSFPVDPSLQSVDNCFKNVDDRAEIFVLVVGSRYGSIGSDGKSVTNLEYLRARAKGIPIYAFISRSILGLLPYWKENPNSKFQIDSPKLFEFVDSIRSEDGCWTFPFDNAGDVISALRQQWALLFLEGVQLWTALKNQGLPSSLRDLTGESLRLVIEKPPYWEYQLFSQVLKDKLASFANLKTDRKLGFASGRYEHVDSADVFA